MRAYTANPNWYTCVSFNVDGQFQEMSHYDVRTVSRNYVKTFSCEVEAKTMIKMWREMFLIFGVIMILLVFVRSFFLNGRIIING